MSNLLLHPNDPSASEWSVGTGTGLSTINFAVAPDGTTTAFKLTDSDGSNVFTRAQAVTVVANTSEYHLIVWVKKTTGATNFPAFDIRFGNPAAPSKWTSVVVNTDTAATSVRSGTTAPVVKSVTSHDANYWKVHISLVNNSQTQVSVFLAPAFNADASDTFNLGTGGLCVMWTPTLSLAPVASFTSIPTSGAAPLSVVFTDTSTGGPDTWNWDFADGVTSTVQSPGSHIFTLSGTYHVTLSVSNAVGSSAASADITATGPVVALVANWRCAGARYLAVSTTSGLTAVSSPQTREVVLASAATDVNSWTYSGDLGAAPGALVHTATLWSVYDDGKVRKLHATTAALLATVDTSAATTAWLAQNAEGIIIAPGPKGEIATLDSTAVIATLRVLPKIDAAAYTTSRYLYCFHDGRGAVVAVTATGLLNKISEFTATACRDVRRAKLTADGKIRVVCRDRIVVFSLTDPTAPTVSSSTTYTDEVFSVVAGDNAVVKLDFDARYPSYDAEQYRSTYTFVGPSPFVQIVT